MCSQRKRRDEDIGAGAFVKLVEGGFLVVIGARESIARRE
jgi:hypothetical protein